ncbi:MAG: NUDIX hydrolase [Halobacteriota archaeon]
MTDPDELRWETLEREVSHRCEAFEVFTDEVRLPDGSTARFDFVREPPSAVVLGFTPGREAVVLREYRHAVGRVALGLPGGSAEAADTDMAETAARELREEAGYAAGGLEPLLVAEPANGLLDSVRHYFVARDCEPIADPDRDLDESIVVETMPYDALRERVLAGRVRDERTVTAVAVYEGVTPASPEGS